MTRVAIIGGGHNGLTAAAYLARAGVAITVLERLSNFGGAAISAAAFEGIEARLSRYSYLVSLLPEQIVEDLGLEIKLAERRYSSYTPVPGEAFGLLVDNYDAETTAASFASIGASEDADAWRGFYGQTRELAEGLWPSVLHPLRRRSELVAEFAATGRGDVWRRFIERPVGEAIEHDFASDLVRGVVYTDALIGTFASNHDESLSANRCFLYHVIGRGTGDWNVPIGGMGAVSGALERAARDAGAELIQDAEVVSVSEDGEVRYLQHGVEQVFTADYVLVNASRQELARLTGSGTSTLSLARPSNPAADQVEPAGAYPHGAQVKVNLLLKRLPKLKAENLDPAAAFGGTFHINESWQQLQAAFEQASAGEIANPLPCEIYCHSLTDPSILSPELQAAGAQTLTVFALHAPHSLLADLSEEDHAIMRLKLQRAVLDSLNSVLAEPIEPLLLLDANNQPCVETKTTRDLEEALRLPGGNIFHEPLSWPFAEDDEPLDSPAQRWGVATENERILLCGSAAKRGGAVSGIAGHNAAMAVLEMLGKSAN